MLIQRAKSTDSGKYTCLPSTANPMTVHVHVLNGKWQFAMCFAMVRR
uniref:Ig-like domain-containing protein n=2 Tax=Anopheles stephensi TaxID=30069 RepID=A0A182YTH9_ANOST